MWMFSALGIGANWTIIHTDPDVGRTLAQSVVCLCGIYPSCSLRGEMLFKELSFATLFLEGWPMTKITIQFFLIDHPHHCHPHTLLKVSHDMALYWHMSCNVICAHFSFSCLSLYPLSSLSSTEAAGLSQHEKVVCYQMYFSITASED